MQQSAYRTLMMLTCSALLVGTACNRGTPLADTGDRAEARHGDAPSADQPFMPAATDRADADEPVVTVNGHSLTRGELDRRVRMIAMRQGIPAEAIDQAIEMMGSQFEQQVVDQFIDVTLLLTEAEQRGINAQAEKVDAVIEAILADLPPGMTFETLLARQGVSPEEVRADIEKSERIKALVDDETADIAPVSEEAVQAFYDEHPEHFTTPEKVTASHILIRVDEDAADEEKAAAREKIEALREELLAGNNDFETLAREHSACPSGQEGGSLGAFGRGQMVGPFEEAAFSQAIGEVGPVVETRFGFHLIKVDGRDESGVTPLDEVREDITEYLSGDEKGEKIQALLKVLRKQARIEYP